jgi:uncharacterized protein YjbI with pentapeptide repeats
MEFLATEDVSMSGVSAPESNLTKAKLIGANLIDANLREADLGRAKLSGANLFNADLSGAKLGNVELIGADLTNADLRCLPPVEGENVPPAKKKKRCADLTDAKLDNAILTGAKLKGAIITLKQIESVRPTPEPASLPNSVKKWPFEEVDGIWVSIEKQ